MIIGSFSFSVLHFIFKLWTTIHISMYLCMNLYFQQQYWSIWLKSLLPSKTIILFGSLSSTLTQALHFQCVTTISYIHKIRPRLANEEKQKHPLTLQNIELTGINPEFALNLFRFSPYLHWRRGKWRSQVILKGMESWVHSQFMVSLQFLITLK